MITATGKASVGGAVLASLGRDIQLPLHLQAVDEQGYEKSLKIERVLRLVPGIRLVGLARYGGRTVVIKLFCQPRRWRRHLARELAGSEALAQAGITTPELIESLSLSAGDGGLVLYRYLEHGVPLGDVFEQAASEVEKAALLDKVIGTIARCHRNGLMQSDIHPDNFFLQDDRVYVLDGGAIQRVDVTAGGYLRRLRNLARFLAQFPAAADDRLVPDRYAVYLEGVQWERNTTRPAKSLPSTGQFRQWVDRERDLRLAAYRRKLLRSTSAHRARRIRGYFAVSDRAVDVCTLAQWVANPDRLMEGGRVLKAGNSSTVALIELEGRPAVVKRYNIKGVGHGVKRLFTTTRARRSWLWAHLLRMLGLYTPRPLLMLERRPARLLKGRAWYVCAHIDAPDALSLIQRRGAEAADRVFPLFEELFRVMRRYHISHGDMKATNFLVAENRLYILDLDAMREIRGDDGFRRSFNQDLDRWLRNWAGMGEIESRAAAIVNKHRPGKL